MKATYRLALANLAYPASPEASVNDAVAAIARAGDGGADVIAFPECYVPGYRTPGAGTYRPPTPRSSRGRGLRRGRGRGARASPSCSAPSESRTARFWLTALVIDPDGARAGFQDKVQLDPSEDRSYTAGTRRRIFQVGALTFGVVICHEGWRYPETVRWAADAARTRFHPQYHEAEPGSSPGEFADPANTFHEKAILCRAAENTCYFASVNCAGPGSPIATAIARPDGTLLSSALRPARSPPRRPRPAAATGLLARRLKDYA